VCRNYPACDSYVGTCPGTDIPLGLPADAELRVLRIRAHRAFDALWRSGIMDRESAYRWMADRFAIPVREAHIAKFGPWRCRELIRMCDGVLARREALRPGAPEGGGGPCG